MSKKNFGNLSQNLRYGFWKLTFLHSGKISIPVVYKIGSKRSHLKIKNVSIHIIKEIFFLNEMKFFAVFHTHLRSFRATPTFQNY